MLPSVESHHRPPSWGVNFGYSHHTAAPCSGGGLDEYHSGAADAHSVRAVDRVGVSTQQGDTKMADTHEGGCLCGTVRYRVVGNPNPTLTGVCHCTLCQRRTGSAFGI